MPETRIKDVNLRIYADSDRAIGMSTSRPRMGFLIYINIDFIQWLSKKQPKIEMSFFGAYFVAMKHGMEAL